MTANKPSGEATLDDPSLRSQDSGPVDGPLVRLGTFGQSETHPFRDRPEPFVRCPTILRSPLPAWPSVRLWPEIVFGLALKGASGQFAKALAW